MTDYNYYNNLISLHVDDISLEGGSSNFLSNFVVYGGKKDDNNISNFSSNFIVYGGEEKKINPYLKLRETLIELNKIVKL